MGKADALHLKNTKATKLFSVISSFDHVAHDDP